MGLSDDFDILFQLKILTSVVNRICFEYLSLGFCLKMEQARTILSFVALASLFETSQTAIGHDRHRMMLLHPRNGSCIPSRSLMLSLALSTYTYERSEEATVKVYLNASGSFPHQHAWNDYGNNFFI